MNVGSLQIDIIANLARLQNDMDKVNKSVDSAMRNVDKSVGIARAAFSSLSGAIGVGTIIKLADEYKRFDSQLKLATKTTKEYEAAYSRVVGIARTSQSDIGAIGVLYARLTNNLREFGTSQKDIGNITESVALSLRVSNATVQETNSVMLQLSQSFGSGRINGQEFLAVSEGAPIIMRQLAKSLNVTYGELKNLSAEGKLTAETLKTALTDPAYLAGLQEQVKAVGTISSAMTVFTNSLKVFIGEADKANGAGQALAQTIIFLGDNLQTLANIGLALIVGSLSKYVASVYAGIAASKLKQAELIKEQIIIERKAAVEAAAAFASANNARMVTLQATRNSAAILENAAVQRELAARTTTAATAVRGLGTAISFMGGWVGLTITGVVLFGDKLLDMGKKALGITPAMERLNDLMERNAELRAKGLDQTDPLAAEKSKLQDDLKLLEQNRKASERYYAISKGAAQATKEEIAALRGLSVGFMSTEELRKKAGERASAYAQIVIQRNSAIKDSQVKLDIDADASVRKQKLADAELLKDLKTKSQITKEYQEQVRKVTEAQSRSNLSDAEKQEQLALLKGAYDKAIGAVDKKTGSVKAESKAQKAAKEADKERQQSILELVKAQEELIEANNKARQSVIDASLSDNDALQKQIDSTKENIDLLRLGEEAYNFLAESKLRDAIATSEQIIATAKLNGATADAIKYAEDYVQTLRERLALQEELSSVKRQEKAYKAEKDAIEKAEKARIDSIEKISKEEERASDNFSKSLTDAIFRGFERGESIVENFKNTLINSFKTLVLQPAIKFLVDGSGLSKVLGAVGSIFSGGALAGEGGSVGGLGGFGGLKDVFTSITQGFDNAGMALTNSIGDFGSWVGGFGEAGGAIESFGKLISNNNVLIGQASSFIGAGISLLKGDIKGAASQGAGAGLGLLLSGGNPIGGAIGSMLGGMIGGMFGGGLPPRITASRSGVFSGGKFAASEGLDKGKRKIGGESSLDNLNEVFSKQLGTLFSAFNVNQAIGTNSLLTKKKNVRARFNASIGGTQLAGYEQSFGKKGDFNVALQEMVNNALGAVTVQAIQASSLSSGIKSIFDGMTKKEEVSALINSVINLNKAQKELAKNFGITVDQSAQAAKATGLMGAALAGYVDKLTSAALATRTIGDALIGARTNILDVMGNALGAVSTQAVTSLVARQVQKTVPATAVGSSRQSGFGFSGTAITGFLSFVKPMMQTVTETVYDSVTEYVDTVTPIAAELPTSLKGFDELLKSINKNSAAGIKQFNDLFAIRDQFIQFTKAMDGLKGNVRGALFSMVSDAEKRKMLNEDLAKLFGDFGRTVPASIDELIALGKSIDYTTAEGLNLASVFPTLVDAFNKTKSAVDSLVESLRDASTFKTLIDFRRYQGIARNYGAEFANQRWDNIASYDTGTSYVPKDGMAMIHEGEAVLTKSQNASITHDSSTIVSELKALRTEVTNLRYSADRTAIHSKRAADVLVNVSPNGDAIQTELAA
jgi:tape measure domain-containing protein